MGSAAIQVDLDILKQEGEFPVAPVNVTGDGAFQQPREGVVGLRTRRFIGGGDGMQIAAGDMAAIRRRTFSLVDSEVAPQ